MKFMDPKKVKKDISQVWLKNPRGRIVDVPKYMSEEMMRRKFFVLASEEEIAEEEARRGAGEVIAKKKGKKTAKPKVERSAKVEEVEEDSAE